METIKRVLKSKIFLFAALLAVIWMGLVSIRAYYKKNQLDQEIASLKDQIGKLNKQDQGLSQLIQSFNNTDFLAKEAKDKLNLKAEGENVVMVQEAAIGQDISSASATSSNQTPVVQPPPPSENNFVKWWNYLFGR